MKAQFKSRWANYAARACHYARGGGLVFYAPLSDIYGYVENHLRANYQREIVTLKEIIDEYMHANQVHKLQIGAGGNNPSGWLNTDIEPTPRQAYVDASKPLPFADGSVRLRLR